MAMATSASMPPRRHIDAAAAVRRSATPLLPAAASRRCSFEDEGAVVAILRLHQRHGLLGRRQDRDAGAAGSWRYRRETAATASTSAGRTAGSLRYRRKARRPDLRPTRQRQAVIGQFEQRCARAEQRRLVGIASCPAAEAGSARADRRTWHPRPVPRHVGAVLGADFATCAASARAVRDMATANIRSTIGQRPATSPACAVASPVPYKQIRMAETTTISRAA